jgi:hypothetical protein
MLEAIFRIVALTRKELLAILKDPRSRYSLLIPPILQCLIYGYVATYDLNDVPYAVFDQDRSAASQRLLARLDGSGVFHRVANLGRAADIRTTINERRAVLVIQIVSHALRPIAGKQRHTPSSGHGFAPGARFGTATDRLRGAKILALWPAFGRGKFGILRQRLQSARRS